ncbi:MAG TPA: shikimate dehydrogenase [Clostridiales bacterium]|nr:shikimate dehydrogenase [Clostridiales bacterium]
MYGLIGGKLGHSYSKMIHEKLADYEYNLIPLNEEEFHDFMKKRAFKAINITIPYKEAVIPYLDFLDSSAKNIGAVNTILKKDNKLIGSNTDYYGFEYLLLNNNINIDKRSCIIIGNGGAAKAVKAVIKDLAASEIKIISLRNVDNTISYEEAYKNYNDVEVIINTSPVGMYPDIDKSPIDLKQFKNLESVVDVIYNPIETKLYKDAISLGINSVTGLEMLVAQAKAAVEIFTDKSINKDIIHDIYSEILNELIQN